MKTAQLLENNPGPKAIGAAIAFYDSPELAALIVKADSDHLQLLSASESGIVEAHAARREGPRSGASVWDVSTSFHPWTVLTDVTIGTVSVVESPGGIERHPVVQLAIPRLKVDLSAHADESDLGLADFARTCARYVSSPRGPGGAPDLPPS